MKPEKLVQQLWDFLGLWIKPEKLVQQLLGFSGPLEKTWDVSSTTFGNSGQKMRKELVIQLLDIKTQDTKVIKSTSYHGYYMSRKMTAVLRRN